MKGLTKEKEMKKLLMVVLGSVVSSCGTGEFTELGAGTKREQTFVTTRMALL